MTEAANVHTPVPGLLLPGHDLSGLGIRAAWMSGRIATAAIGRTPMRRPGG